MSQLADVRYARWEVHKDWVVELKYEDHLRSIISCSNDPSTGVVIGKSVLRLLLSVQYVITLNCVDAL